MRTMLPMDLAQADHEQADHEQAERLALERTRHYLTLASDTMARVFHMPTVSFNLRGKTAGMYRYHSDGSSEIRYNHQLLCGQPDDFVSRTVPHEVAHLVAFALHGRRIRPHGREWQAIMAIFGADPARCHDYDLSSITKRQYRRFAYHCGCREHHLTSIRHHRVQSGTQYVCRQCHQPLTCADN